MHSTPLDLEHLGTTQDCESGERWCIGWHLLVIKINNIQYYANGNAVIVDYDLFYLKV